MYSRFQLYTSKASSASEAVELRLRRWLYTGTTLCIDADLRRVVAKAVEAPEFQWSGCHLPETLGLGGMFEYFCNP